MQSKIFNTIVLAILVSGIVFCGGRVVYDVFATSTDMTPPQLSNVNFPSSSTMVHPGSYLMIYMTVTDDNSGVKAVNVIVESPSGNYLHAEVNSGATATLWKASILIPVDAEKGNWKIRSIYLADNTGNNKTLYYGTDITYTFTVDGEPITTYPTLATCESFTYGNWTICRTDGIQKRAIVSSYPSGCMGGHPVLSQTCTYVNQCNSSRPYLDTQAKDNCTSSSGTWDAETCICTCLPGWHIVTIGTSCVLETTNTTIPACTDASYTEWGPCTEGTQTRSLLSGVTCSGAILTRTCTDEAVIVDNPDPTTTTTNYCSTRAEENTAKQQSCTSSHGTWDSSTCVCTCPSGYSLNGTSCVSTTINIENPTCTGINYTDWGECKNGYKYRTVTGKIPEGCVGGPEEDTVDECSVCATTEEWVCGDWSTCTNNIQKRTCNKNSKCPTVTSASPITEQTCISAVQQCSYTYTDWGACDTTGKQHREVKTALPTGCKETTKDLVKACDSCLYYYTDWSACVDGKRTRTVSYKYPENCSGTPVVEEACDASINQNQVSTDCAKIGWTNKSDCDLYTYREKVITNCKNNNLTTFDACREYIINQLGKPDKCKEISGAACDNLINNVILSNFNDSVSTAVKQNLSTYTGSSATINPEQKVITVQIDATATTPAKTEDVKVEELPITSSAPGGIPVTLLPIENTSAQQSLSPVAITFDADGDGLPDDMENRIGTDPNKKDTDGDGIDDNVELKNGTNPLDPLSNTTSIVLSGVDKAIVDGKPLDQPKFADTTVSSSVAVNSVETVNKSLQFKGKANPNQVITLYIYSAMPIVVTVQADMNGNWVYELDKTLVDGTHEAYVAINNDQGKIIEASLPTPFFIAQAQAVSLDGYVSGDASQVSDNTTGMMILYVIGGLVVVFVFIAAILIIRQRYSE